MRSTQKLIRWDSPAAKVYDHEEPWNRQPCDSENGWQAFRLYLMLPLPRTLKALSQAMNGGAFRIDRLAKLRKKGHWDLRAAAFDNHVHESWQRNVQAYVETKAKDYTQVHLDLLSKAERLASNELRKYVEASYANDALGLVKVNELNKLIENTIKLGRLVHGEATDRVDMGVDLSHLSVVELRELKRLQAKAKEGSESE